MAKKKRPRELMSPRGDKRYVRRNKKGQLKDVVDVGRSLAADRRHKAKKTVGKGFGDQGDGPPAKPKLGPRLNKSEVKSIMDALDRNKAGWADKPAGARLWTKLLEHHRLSS